MDSCFVFKSSTKGFVSLKHHVSLQDKRRKVRLTVSDKSLKYVLVVALRSKSFFLFFSVEGKTSMTLNLLCCLNVTRVKGVSYLTLTLWRLSNAL